MAHITYGGDGAVEWFGLPFSPNLPVDLDATSLDDERKEALLAKARRNPFFSVEDGGAAAKGVATEEDEADEEFGDYEVKHRGRGKFAVLKGDATIAEGLTREEAEAHARDLAAADAAAHG